MPGIITTNTEKREDFISNCSNRQGMHIQEIRFHFDFYIKVSLTDPAMCILFLEAFKNLTPAQSWPGNMMECIEIFYENGKNVPLYTQILFNAQNADMIGLSFCNALIQLGVFLAREVREFVVENEAEIVAVEISGRHMTRPDEIAMLLSILKQVDENAFAFAKANNNVHVTLHTRNNQSRTFDMSIANDIPNALFDFDKS